MYLKCLKMQLKLIFAFLFYFVHIKFIYCTSNLPTLVGAVSKHSVIPGFYIEKYENGSYYGFSKELLDKIAHKVGFHYWLFDSPSLNLMSTKTKRLAGAVGEVNASQADFAIGNIQDCPNYPAFVDLTEPIINFSHVSAIVSRAHAHRLCTIDDLLDKCDANQFGIGCLGHFFYFESISKWKHPFAKRLRKTVLKQYDLEINITQALNKIKREKYAFLLKSHMAEYLAQQDCDLTVLREHHGLFQRNVVIALQKGSPYLSRFNEVIRELHADGTIRRLQRQFWNTDKCTEPIYHCT